MERRDIAGEISTDAREVTSTVTRAFRIVEVATGSYLEPMRAVGIKTLKNKLSEYVRLAASGETVLVTDRDRVVAELVPPAPGRGDTLADAKLDQAIRRGWVTQPGQIKGLGPPPRGEPIMTFEELMRELDESREDRF
jgi:prevent-host-death family protein